ncbi:hypothetical protein BDW22DRAFT_537827 [Trametopsis cervina]|nr:hypothetical protein BDW22DRAFT_537827 [Trametopsis cervina]
MQAILAHLDNRSSTSTATRVVPPVTDAVRDAISYWELKQWNAVKYAKGRTPANGVKVKPYDFLQDDSGQSLQASKLDLIRNHACSLYAYMLDKQEVFSKTVKRWKRDHNNEHFEFIRDKMYAQWPKFTYCADDWKLHHFLTIHYPSWARIRFPDDADVQADAIAKEEADHHIKKMSPEPDHSDTLVIGETNPASITQTDTGSTSLVNKRQRTADGSKSEGLPRQPMKQRKLNILNPLLKANTALVQPNVPTTSPDLDYVDLPVSVDHLPASQGDVDEVQKNDIVELAGAGTYLITVYSLATA